MIKSKFGFTLIELLVVITIIGILVTILIVAINPIRQVQNAQDTKRRSDLNQIKAAMQLYYNENKYYPTTATSIPFGNCWSSGGGCTGTIYMRQVPNDSGGAYTYTGTGTCGTSCTDYRITADLNNPNSEDAKTVTKCSAGSVDFSVCND